MIFQLLYYSYYLNYGLYFIGTYYVCGVVNLSHDIYTKITKNHNPEILFLMENIDDNDWIIIYN